MRIFLLRHGQTTGDVEDRYCGDYDDHLTEVGVAQAGVLARSLDSEIIDRIFTSPKARAMETAAILAKKRVIQVEVVENLREHGRYGVLTGMTRLEAKKRSAKLVAMLEDRSKTVEGAESYDVLRQRVMEAIQHIFSCGLERVAIVTHNGVIGCIYRELIIARTIKVEDCGYLVLQGEADSLEVVDSKGVEFLEYDDVPMPSSAR